MLILNAVLTKKTAALYDNPTPKTLNEAAGMHAFLISINVTQLEEGLSFHVEAAKDAEGNVYRDIYMIVNSQYTLNGDKFLSNGGISVNIQPLISFLDKVLQDNKKS